MTSIWARRRMTALFQGIILALYMFAPAAFAGDSAYGKVIAVKRADLVTFDHGAGSYDIHIAGIEVAKDDASAGEATRFMTELLLNKPARLRFDGRNSKGEMVGRLHTDDPAIGIKDAGIELVRNGLAMPQSGYRGYKYDEPGQALKDARARKLGMWREQQPNR
jgi:hypothetical protein